MRILKATIILAAAGLKRLGYGNRITDPFDTDVLVPAPGQGALGIECRAGDDDILSILQSVHDENTAIACQAERRVLLLLEGGCNTPVGVHAECDGKLLHLVAVVADPDGTRYLKDSAEGDAASWKPIAEGLVARLREQGASEIIESTRDAS